ncbi:hypothetical protein VTN49DRAFT_3198 [Thermomyces lanuginosus]|uniref:uncharacterized protein n=1 Tax=Thermomyces lanuginosus TaxID=5541 RepID=UPI00374395C4
MPYLPTSQAFLEQSSQLLEAYPNDTRITTKYSFPSRPSRNSRKPASASTEATPTATPAAPIATLELKTYNPVAGICLKYRTNKAAEVGRLITGLGKLASGAKISSETAPPAGTSTADVEMTDAPAAAAPQEETKPAAAGSASAAGGGGGGGKKKKKGKR